MKTLTLSPQTSLIRTIIMAFFTALIVILPLFVKAQLPIKEESSSLTPLALSDSPQMKISSFTARWVEGVVYLNWLMRGEEENSIFIIERSDNDSEFYALGSCKGYPAPSVDKELLYCFSDNTEVDGIVQYRIKQYIKDVMITSTIIEIEHTFIPPLVEFSGQK